MAFPQSLVLLSIFLSAQMVRGQDIVLASWHDFSQGFQAFRYSGSAKDAESERNGVSGKLYGGDGARNTWGSTDGTYGPSQPIGSNATDGAMSIRVDKPKVHFAVTNQTGGNLTLSTILFDFSSISVNAPRNLSAYYTSGGLGIPNDTLLLSLTNITNGLTFVDDYEDVSISLANLADQTLAPGQSANFRFEVDTANVNNQALTLDNIAIMGSSSDFRVLTYNIHGGLGANDAGDLVTNLTTFRDDYLRGEDVLCLQEVDVGGNWTTLKNIFADYPYTYQTVNTTTGFVWPWESQQQTSCAILSKHPFANTHNKLIQIDPQGDNWERHAQHVQIQLGTSLVHLFNFHNTYNFFDDDYASEKEGLTKFRTYVEERLGANALTGDAKLLMLGDFNVLQSNDPNSGQQDVVEILPTPDRVTNGLDHIVSLPFHVNAGTYSTVAASLSDHNAVWAAFDLSPPLAEVAEWASPPATINTTSISMTASSAIDPGGVQYYFSNLSVPDTSHDSGWQSSATFLDSGLNPATNNSYSVQTRDKSANLNQGSLSTIAEATTDDGDILPNDWEELYFGSLLATSGQDSEDWDEDGFSDYQEWIAGTDPTNRLSRLEATLQILEEGELTITWSSVAGKSYTVTTSTTMTGSWIPAAPLFVAQDSESLLEISLPDDPMRFYRVEVEL